MISSLGPLELQAGAAAAPGEDAVFIAVAEAGPLSLMLETDGERLSGGLQSMLSTDFGFLAAGIAADRDSISSTGTLMPRIRWGGSGWIHGGFSWQVTRTDSSTVGTMDLRSLFTLGRFAFIFALEDVLDDYRSYSFGITWSFTDEPPKVIEEEARG